MEVAKSSDIPVADAIINGFTGKRVKIETYTGTVYEGDVKGVEGKQLVFSKCQKKRYRGIELRPLPSTHISAPSKYNVLLNKSILIKNVKTVEAL